MPNSDEIKYDIALYLSESLKTGIKRYFLVQI